MLNARNALSAGLPPLSSERLAGLSDTMFGVAMTLLATTLLPLADQLSGSALEMMQVLREPLSAVVLSFAVSAVYWLSQQRRLSMTKLLTPVELRLHLVFLFLIVLLPISTGLFARTGSSPASVAIFGAHLALISAANLALWVGVHRQVEAWAAIVPASASVTLLAGGFAVGLVWPKAAQYLWYSALGIPVVMRSLQKTIGCVSKNYDR
jgi:uncharacterized membrane protein